MEFRDNIRELRKEFFNVVKQYYDTSNLILKMISNKGIYSGLSDADLAFRTCMLSNFSDKNINKLYDKDKEKAIENLRVRGIACLYVVDGIKDMMFSSVNISKNYVDFVQKLKSINARLRILSKKSIDLSNEIAKENGYPLFDASKFDLSKEEFDEKINSNNIY